MQLIEEKKDSNRFKIKIYIALREMEGRIKMKLNKRNSKGITLIALIVTIIGILILASVSINILFGENGIIEKTKRARGEYNNSQIAEQQDLEEVEKQLAEYENTLPENTAQNPQNAGTQVKMPSSWYTTIPAYISTEDGKTIKRSVKVASVVAVATGNGETVPVPNDFYYVGGTISSGVVISDNKEDQNKYVDEENGDVPAGVVYNEDGTINKESSDLKGNQFVWIPVEANNYKKMDLGKANANWEKQTNTAELPQIQKYGGFYIGRYEAGTSEITLSTGIDFAGQNTASGWQNSKFSIRNGLNQTSTGKITQKAGEIPYYHADYETALKLCNDMYQTEYIQSGLVTGTMWDAMMKFIAGGDDRIITSLSSWGNYNNGNVKYTIGNGRYAEINPDNGEMLKYNETGELCFCTPSHMLGYLDNEEETKKICDRDEENRLWVHTGDLGFVDEDGFVHFVGRIKRIYITQDADGTVYKLFPQRIEETITEYPEVDMCAVVVELDAQNIATAILYRNKLLSWMKYR